MTTFSVTEIGGFHACRRQWWHGSQNGLALTSATPNKNLLLGSLIHYTLADWSIEWAKGNRDIQYPVKRFEAHWQAAADDIHEKYYQRNGFLISTMEFEALYQEPVHDIGVAMIRNYRDHYGEPYPSKQYELVEAEQPITVPIPGTGTRHRPPRNQHFLEGTFDLLLRDRVGRYVIPDHKTFEKRPSSHENQQNDQFLRYLWMANEVWGERGNPATGEGRVVGVMYNGLWKRAEPPRDKRTGKLLKSTATGDPYTLADLFYRDLILHDEEEIAEVGYYLPEEVKEMEHARTHPEARYPTHSWATCPGCGITDLCSALSRGEDTSEYLEELVPRVKTPAWRAS